MSTREASSPLKRASAGLARRAWPIVALVLLVGALLPITRVEEAYYGLEGGLPFIPGLWEPESALPFRVLHANIEMLPGNLIELNITIEALEHVVLSVWIMLVDRFGASGIATTFAQELRPGEVKRFTLKTERPPYERPSAEVTYGIIYYRVVVKHVSVYKPLVGLLPPLYYSLAIAGVSVAINVVAYRTPKLRKGLAAFSNREVLTTTAVLLCLLMSVNMFLPWVQRHPVPRGAPWWVGKESLWDRAVKLACEIVEAAPYCHYTDLRLEFPYSYVLVPYIASLLLLFTTIFAVQFLSPQKTGLLLVLAGFLFIASASAWIYLVDSVKSDIYAGHVETPDVGLYMALAAGMLVALVGSALAWRRNA